MAPPGGGGKGARKTVPKWCHRLGRQDREAVYETAALPLSYGGPHREMLHVQAPPRQGSSGNQHRPDGLPSL
jgi:hypothetical protein